ncbi:MAG: 4-aminobutyrate--2-oxoglutarate transaminase [Thermaerobacter sp.]
MGAVRFAGGGDSPAPAGGARGQDLLERRRQAVPRGVWNSTPLFIDRAEGALVWDVDGNRYIDFAGGIGVLNVGHGRSEVTGAVRAQAERFTHTCFHVAMYEGYVAVAEWLNRRTPGTHARKTLLVNSGAEAVENAVKIARAYTGRPGIIAFENAFHGRTMMGLSLTGKINPYKAGFGPFPGEVYRVPYPDPYRNPFGDVDPVDGALAALERLLVTQVPADRVAAVIVEPVQGEGGFVVPPRGFLARLSQFCRRHGILLIVDEIQTGFGRTGRLWACEHEDVVPDLFLTAKSLAAGMPLAAVTGRAEIMDAPAEGGLGGTYGGNPVACAAALEVFRLFDETDLLESARRVGAAVLERFQSWCDRFPLVGHVRGLGAMVAVELVRDRQTKEPASDEASEIVQLACRRGLIVLKSGLYGNVIRFLAPLSIPEDLLQEGLDILEGALAEVAGRGAGR